ncbi:hypothetical protein DSM112329_03378 [Paraconexibacter sp. AEG42_29]|uniref:Peptidase n=1 Tax=Paraconexibacter sp. AEG42_29 TaxID=2997339 RepID=A0AAU7AXZ9_9ACTN
MHVARRLAVLLFCAALTGLGGVDAARAAAPDRYSLVHGCYDVRGGQAAAPGGPFRMQATGLGRYLLYGPARTFLTVSAAGVPVTAATPGPSADFDVTSGADGFALENQAGRRLALGGTDRLTFTPAEGCAVYPEADTDSTGTPASGPTPYGETRGLLDAHMHLMGFEFLGGKAHCGRPWHAYGITYALAACEDGAAGDLTTNVLETALGGGSPVNDPVGWPTFRDWPAYNLLAHEGSYYKWLERAWRGGLRVYVNLFVENHTLCTIWPLKKNSCNEMDAVRLQARRLKELEEYIDAQEGGPGKGWFRLVDSPFQARRVVNAGKLAVVRGIEISQLLDCGVQQGVAQCDNDDIDRQLDAVYALGVRDLEITGKIDNGFGGVAGDEGALGLLTNTSNFLETGRFLDLETCTGPAGEADRTQVTAPTPIANVLGSLQASGLSLSATTPLYPPGPHCNRRGLTPQGEHLVKGMIKRGMIIDPDHLDVASRTQVLDIIERAGYSGVISSHSWSTRDAYARIYKAGGVVTPIAKNAKDFVAYWERIKPLRDPKRFFGFGYGADQNGFAVQGAPRRGRSPVTYPFRSFDGAVTFDRSSTGSRTWDINVDGVANYGLYPDWIEDLRRIAGEEIVADMGRGAEAYLQMWERAVGVGVPGCRAARLRFTGAGIGLLRFGATAEDLLRGAGQPQRRVGRTFTYCVRGKAGGRLRAVITPGGTVGLLVSTAPRHRVAGVGRGSRGSAIRASRPFGPGLRVKPAGRGRTYVYGVRTGRVRFAGVADKGVASSPAALRGYLRHAGLRP